VNSDPNPTKGDVPIALSEGEALIAGSSVPSEEEIAEEQEAEEAAQEAEEEKAAAKAAAAKKKAVQKAAAAKTSATAKVSAKLPAVSGYFGNPLPGGRKSQGLHGHNGVDISAPAGTPIYAAASGTVTTVKNDGGWNSGYGNYVVISHPNGTSTLYAHMSRVAASGGSVSKGSVIGYVGMTGSSTGNHLHFEVHGAKNPF
jgi:murein DD-endopeptidase MepM/ murein hydrolase activator NlpD